MGTYISVRGWIECREESIPQIKAVISSFIDKARDYRFDATGAEMYNQGWVIPDTHINWTHYIFYGADIRIQRLSYIRDQLKTLTKEIIHTEDWATDYLTGIFHADHEDGTESYIWKLSEGEFYEEKITRCSQHE
ncbi:hypothetical protein [Undibacterium umbellatum]|uniref:Uncharacterized protein n=1 Tax=Undibacterium umbellatum TaxID=2762300 RepID=A0ABR6Z8X8_9BURK|nr:hypothetical protein [Undibacterium umbellatum]MBC3908220.1 hypothetical protein [Undibacterium umbellatum]